MNILYGMYDSRLIANAILKLARDDEGNTLTPMQLIKLVYIAHGWMLGLYHRPLIKDEVQAWQYGPVIPRLYNAVRGFKHDSVTYPISAEDAKLDAATSSILGQVYHRYRAMSGSALSRLTHASGTPWAKTYEPGSFGRVIPNDLIEDHYAQLAAKAA